MSQQYTLVFYASGLYGQYPFNSKLNILHGLPVSELPDGAFIRFPVKVERHHWYLNDLTPFIEEQVPKHFRLLASLLT